MTEAAGSDTAAIRAESVDSLLHEARIRVTAIMVRIFIYYYLDIQGSEETALMQASGA